MKKLLCPGVILLVGLSSAYAIPMCNDGDSCRGFAWNTKHATFVCPDTCKCGTKTHTCVQPCGVALCMPLDGTWTTVSDGYEKKVDKECTNNYELGTCERTESTSYRCAAGYYGRTVNGTTGCTRCPSSGGVYGTSAAGSTAITSCYIPSGTTSSDGTGTFEYTEDCYYTN